MAGVSGRVWQRAAIYGSLWAASEIVAGSFLHNLRIPFAGSLLAASGVMMMTAGHRLHPERGLIWRAALVCALMKSISPSAVILGPMVGIAMEGLLLEAGVRLARGRAAGYLIGGAAAVSWSMAQRIITAIIAFGGDVVRLYVDAYRFAARSLAVESFGPFDLIWTFVVLEWLAGLAAAAVGLRVAGRVGNKAAPLVPGAAAAPAVFPEPPIEAEGPWSLRRLAAAAFVLVGGMMGLSRLPLAAAALVVAAFAAWVLAVYPRAAGRIRRLSLWLELLAVMLLAGLVFGLVRHGASGLAGGLAEGAAMALRAVMVIVGFTAISAELRNPSILAFVERRKLRGLSDALGVAFGILPAFTGALADRRRSWRRPGRVLADLLAVADSLVLAHAPASSCRRVVLLTGPTGSGKTTMATEVVKRLRQAGVRVGGVLAPGLLADERRTGFDLLDIATGQRAGLARERPGPAARHAQWGRFSFLPDGLALGARALGPGAAASDVIVVDEVGPFELSGGGWAEALDALARGFPGALLLVARESVAEAVAARWGAAETIVCRVDGDAPERVAGLLDARATGAGSSSAATRP
ncbi:MAG TPA: nucleoside-triphosphatase [Vicinamibacterales bacterium]|nr:nucleoside-triphosphatase [Vicinamibacterales bacterium]HPW20265.1 nucleoside-triphosphatase [Vicinamibacterales bacterium]